MSKETKSDINWLLSHALGLLVYTGIMAWMLYSFIFPPMPFAQTYYVDGCSSFGNNSNSGLSWQTPKKTIMGALTIANQAGDVVEVSGYNPITSTAQCVYNERIPGTAWKTHSITLRGSSESGYTGEVVITTVGGALIMAKQGLQAHNITVKGSTGGNYNLAVQNNTGFVLSSIRSSDAENHLYMAGATNFQFSNFVFKGINTLNPNAIVLDGGVVGQFSYGKFIPDYESTTKQYAVPVNVKDTGGANDIEIKNALFNNHYNFAIQWSSGAGRLRVYNTTYMNNQLGSASPYIKTFSDGISTVINYNGYFSQWGSLNSVWGSIVQNVNMLSSNTNYPNFQSQTKEGIIFWSIDDDDLDYFEQVANVINPYGQYLTAFVNAGTMPWTTSSISSANGRYDNGQCSPTWTSICGMQNRLSNLINRGNDIGGHGLSHADLTADVAMRVWNTAGTAISIDPTTQSIYLYDGDDWQTHQHQFTWTNFNWATNDNSDIPEICNSINNYNCGTGGIWRCEWKWGDGLWNTNKVSWASLTYRDGNVNFRTHPSGLASQSTLAVSSGWTTLALDWTTPSQRFLANEITANNNKLRDWISSTGITTIRSFAPPFGNNSATVNSKLYADGLLGSKTGGTSRLSDVNRYTIDDWNPNTTNVFDKCLLAAEGYIIGTTIHYLAAHPLATITSVAEQLSQCRNISLMNFGNAMVKITTPPWTTFGTWTSGYSTRDWVTWGDNSDYTPRKCSPLRDWGTPLGNTADFNGNRILGTPDTGLIEYQYQEQKWGSNVTAWRSFDKTTWATTNKSYNKWKDMNCIKNTRWGT